MYKALFIRNFPGSMQLPQNEATFITQRHIEGHQVYTLFMSLQVNREDERGSVILRESLHFATLSRRQKKNHQEQKQIHKRLLAFSPQFVRKIQIIATTTTI